MSKLVNSIKLTHNLYDAQIEIGKSDILEWLSDYFLMENIERPVSWCSVFIFWFSNFLFLCFLDTRKPYWTKTSFAKKCSFALWRQKSKSCSAPMSALSGPLIGARLTKTQNHAEPLIFASRRAFLSLKNKKILINNLWAFTCVYSSLFVILGSISAKIPFQNSKLHGKYTVRILQPYETILRVP